MKSFQQTSRLIGTLTLALLGATAPDFAKATPYLYETFGGNSGEIAALNLDVTTEYAAHSGNIGAVVAGGGKVYWTEGINLWSANNDLSSAAVLHVNGLAPNGLAIDPTAGYLFETFGGNTGEIASLNLDVTTEFAAHDGNIGAVVAGGGKVYWTEGVNLWSANDDLSGASILHVNGLAPTGLAIDATAGYLFETFSGNSGEIASLNLGVTTEFAAHDGNIGAVVAGGGKVYWTEGINLWSANDDLSGASILHVNGLAPNGLALQLDPSAPVPELASWVLLCAGLAGLGVRRGRSQRRA